MRLALLRDAGVSIWLDSLSRDMLRDGHFTALIDLYAITGATSNPTIFAKAISESAAYDEQLRGLVSRGQRNLQELFFAAALLDVDHAAQLLQPVYEATGGHDGYVSFECTPDVAYDTEATVHQATELWHRMSQPNVMVKVPATTAGVPAIEELTYRGVNVNVTLLFSAERSLEVLDAYINGMSRRAQEGRPLGSIASAASVFLSRIDGVVDGALPDAWHGTVAIAIAQRTYLGFRRRMAQADWLELAGAGARPQRLLWASTAPKSADLRDTHYVEALAGSGVIATLPEKILQAFADHGVARRDAIELDRSASDVLARAAQAGVDLQDVAAQLERDGVDAFMTSYRELLECVSRRASSVAA